MREKLSKEKKYVVDWVDVNKRDCYKISDAIWNYAELGMEEYKSSRSIVAYIEKNDFTVETSVADMPTAFVATWGSGKPVVSFSASYSALPGLSQEKGISQKSPIVEGALGQGCGHNLLGVGSVMAALALKSAMKALALEGTIKI